MSGLRRLRTKIEEERKMIPILKEGYELIIDDIKNPGCNNENYPTYRILFHGEVVKEGLHAVVVAAVRTLTALATVGDIMIPISKSIVMISPIFKMYRLPL